MWYVMESTCMSIWMVSALPMVNGMHAEKTMYELEQWTGNMNETVFLVV